MSSADHSIAILTSNENAFARAAFDSIDDWTAIHLENISRNKELSNEFGMLLKKIDNKTEKPPDDSEEPEPFTSFDCFILYLRISLYKHSPNGRVGNLTDANDIFKVFLSDSSSSKFSECPNSILNTIQEKLKRDRVSLDLFDPLLKYLTQKITVEYLPYFLKSPQYRSYKSKQGSFRMLPITCEEVMASLEQFESTCEKSKRKQQNQEDEKKSLRAESSPFIGPRTSDPKRATRGMLFSAHRLSQNLSKVSEEKSTSAPTTPIIEHKSDSKNNLTEIQNQNSPKKEDSVDISEDNSKKESNINESDNETSTIIEVNESINSKGNALRPCFQTLEAPKEVMADEIIIQKCDKEELQDNTPLITKNIDNVPDESKKVESSSIADKESEKLSQLKAKLRRLEADIQEQKKRRQTNS